MGTKARVLGIFAGIALIAAVAVTAAGGGVRVDPGITASSITIGGTHPITGPASLYRTFLGRDPDVGALLTRLGIAA